MASGFEEEVNGLIESYKEKLKDIEQSANQISILRLKFIFIRWLPLPTSIRENQEENIKNLERRLQSQVAKLLVFRDEVQASIRSNRSPEIWLPLLDLDKQFKSNAEFQSWANLIDRLRQSLNPEVSPDCWWWFSSNLVDPSGKRLKGGLKLVVRTIWIAACILFIHFSAKVIAGNPDAIGIAAISLNAILSLLVARGILFGVGVIGLLEQVMTGFNIPGRWQQVIQPIFAAFVVIVAALLIRHLPFISNYYYDKAEVAYKKGEFCPSIERCLSKRGPDNFIYHWAVMATRSSNPYADYYRATQFDSENLDAQNRLGEIHEDRGEPEKALGYYQMAARGKSIASVAGLTNVGRYHILKGESDSKGTASYINAITFLDEAYELIRKPELAQYEVQHFPSQLRSKTVDKDFDYACEAAIVDSENNNHLLQRFKRKCAWFELNKYSQRVHAAWAHFDLGETMANSSNGSQHPSSNDFHLDRAKKILMSAIKNFMSFKRYLVENNENTIIQNTNQANNLDIRMRNMAKCLLLRYPENLYKEVQAETMQIRVEPLHKNADFWIQQLALPWTDLKSKDVDECLDTLRDVGKLRSYEAKWWFKAREIKRSLKESLSN